MGSYLKILRPLNLGIVAITQFLLYQSIVLPELFSSGNQVLLSGTTLILFISVTMLLAAGGNLINDIHDAQADLVNKPDKSYIPQFISVKKAWIYYLAIVFTGLLAAIYVGFETGKQALIWIYPAACLMLYLYSFRFQAWPLVGNLIVAGFTALVVWILLWTHPHFTNNPESAGSRLLIAFGIFSFLANLIRELIKDLEDIKGDTLAGARTLPIIWGSIKVRYLIGVLSIILLAVLFMAARSYLKAFYDFRAVAFTFVFLGASIIYLNIKLMKSDARETYSAASRFMKWYMLAGLGLCYMLSKNYYHVDF